MRVSSTKTAFVDLSIDERLPGIFVPRAVELHAEGDGAQRPVRSRSQIGAEADLDLIDGDRRRPDIFNRQGLFDAPIMVTESLPELDFQVRE